MLLLSLQRPLLTVDFCDAVVCRQIICRPANTALQQTLRDKAAPQR